MHPEQNQPKCQQHHRALKHGDGVCVVMTKQTAKRIIDFLETGAKPEHAEEAREIYVAASRAKRLLVLAVPSSQAARLVAHLATTGTTVESLTL